MTADARGPSRGARRRQRVDGVLLLDKHRGISSNHAMLSARRLLSAAKAGHGGTLDPMASGLLPVLLGEATKFAFDLLEADKTYLASIKLGEISSTADAEGNIQPTGEAMPTRQAMLETLAAFTGDIEQIPPMYSALKHEGRPLYEYARKGVEIERTTRRVTVHRIDLLAFELPRVKIRVVCSKGTYLRTLAADIGAGLGCGAWLEDLRREAVGDLKLDDAVSLDALEAGGEDARQAYVAPLDRLLGGLDRVELDADRALRFSQGQKLRVAEPSDSAARRVAVYGVQALLGVATLESGVIAPLRLVASPLSGAVGAAPARGITALQNFPQGESARTDRGLPNRGTTPHQDPPGESRP
ncbi:MAG: tRNA pseudouridine(55) synthase TruB [Betaproteobacteria bacterium]